MLAHQITSNELSGVPVLYVDIKLIDDHNSDCLLSLPIVGSRARPHRQLLLRVCVIGLNAHFFVEIFERNFVDRVPVSRKEKVKCLIQNHAFFFRKK